MRGWLRYVRFSALACLLAVPAAGAQSAVAGRWEGNVSVQAIQLKVVVTLTYDRETLSGTIDIPQQGTAGLVLSAVSSDGTLVHFELNAGPAVAVFDGRINGDVISGTFTQGAAAGSFSVTRGSPVPAASTPAPLSDPAPYVVEDVVIRNGPVTLAGTLTRPRTATRVPAVVLISGSGAQNRDEEVAGFKVFAVLADGLTRHGLAVLRTDDRGIGGSSGSVSESTSEDFAGDALAAVAYLKGRPEIDPLAIGLCGHSEGGIVAPMAAARSADVAFVVLLAGPSLTGDRILLAQAAAISRAHGIAEAAIEKNATVQRRIFEAVRAGAGLGTLRAELRQEAVVQIAALPEAQRASIADPAAYADRLIDGQFRMVESRWFRYFLTHDPAPVLASVRCPVLAIFGERDLQVVPLDENRAAMKTALEKAGNRDVTITVVPGANHLFQAARTGSPTEYGSLEKQFAPGVIEMLGAWISARTTRDPAGSAVSRSTGRQAKPAWVPQQSPSTERLRAISAVSRQVAWASGNKGTVVRTADGGRTWTSVPPPSSQTLDFRDIEAFDASTAYVLAIGPGDRSRIYKTTDGGATWTLLFTNPDPAAFYDAIAFWDRNHGLAVGDPVGGRFTILRTTDGGATWTPIPSEGMPPALEGDGAFAASGTCLVVHGESHAWFGSGGGARARVYRSTDRGLTWLVADTPLMAGMPSAGIFSLAFSDARAGVIVGGDYRQERASGDNMARTTDGGATWSFVGATRLRGFRSAVVYLPASGGRVLVAAGPAGTDRSDDGGATWRAMGDEGYHALSVAPDGSVWAAGEGGRLASWGPSWGQVLK